ncbi:MAG TPA: hypothetical protein VH599_13230 [Ktedonobacterales bacterium]|jgi:hypothetical protein
MSEEMPEQPGTNMQLSSKWANLLAGAVIVIFLLTLVLMVAAIGLLTYGIFSGSAAALIGCLYCLLGVGVLGGLLKKASDLPQKGRLGAALTNGRETYTRVKAELSERYKRAKNSEY